MSTEHSCILIYVHVCVVIITSFMHCVDPYSATKKGFFIDRLCDEVDGDVF